MPSDSSNARLDVERKLSSTELAQLLARNGWSEAADAIYAGEDPITATRRILGQPIIYDDEEGRFLLRYIGRLQA